MSKPPEFDRIVTLARAINATIRQHCDPTSDDGFADTLSAIVGVSAVVLCGAGGNVIHNLEGGAMFYEQLQTMILANQTGELAALYTPEPGK